MSVAESPTKFLLTTADAAASIGVSPKTLRNWRTQGLGPRPTRLSPNDVRYAPDDIARWVTAVRRTGSVKAAPFGGAR